MTRGQHRTGRKALPQGIGLAFLALAVQVLLPFLVAYEIALASTEPDAVMVIGVFALTWTEVSLTSVAGLLTVILFGLIVENLIFRTIENRTVRRWGMQV